MGSLFLSGPRGEDVARQAKELAGEDALITANKQVIKERIAAQEKLIKDGALTVIGEQGSKPVLIMGK